MSRKNGVKCPKGNHKGNTVATLVDITTRNARTEQRLFTVQQCVDIAMITLTDKFGFGKKRLTEFYDTFNENFTEFCKTAI